MYDVLFYVAFKDARRGFRMHGMRTVIIATCHMYRWYIHHGIPAGSSRHLQKDQSEEAFLSYFRTTEAKI